MLTLVDSSVVNSSIYKEHKGTPDAPNVPAVTICRPADSPRRHGLPPEAPLPEASAVALQARRRDSYVLRLTRRRHAHYAPTPARDRQRHRDLLPRGLLHAPEDRKSTRLNSSHTD